MPRFHPLIALLALIVAAAPSLRAENAPSTPIDTANALLSALEHAGEDLTTLQADILYDRRFALQGDRHVREGALYFRTDDAAKTKRAFCIRFDTLRIGDRQEDDPQTWIFDGRWLTEVRPAEKRLVRREVVGEGETFDPLRIGEGPMPIPIGQKADEILARYDATLVEQQDSLNDEAKRYLVEDCWQLLLRPRSDRLDKDEFREIRLWYSKDTLLPRMARTINRARDESFVVLINLQRNEPLPAGAFGVPDTTDGAWEVQIEPLRTADDMR